MCGGCALCVVVVIGCVVVWGCGAVCLFCVCVVPAGIQGRCPPRSPPLLPQRQTMAIAPRRRAARGFARSVAGVRACGGQRKGLHKNLCLYVYVMCFIFSEVHV
jgi:hypothetical protein